MSMALACVIPNMILWLPLRQKRALLNSGKSNEGSMGKKKGVVGNNNLNNELTVILVGSGQWVGNEAES